MTSSATTEPVGPTRGESRLCGSHCLHQCRRPSCWLQFKKTGDLTGLIQGVALLLGGAAWADDLRNWALG